MLPKFPPLPVLGGLSVASVVAVAALAATRPTDGAVSVVVALVLAPVAVTCVAAIAMEIAGTRFAVAAGVVYVVLPFAARFYFYGSYLPVFHDHIAPALVGLRATGWFALGVGLAAVMLTATREPRAAAGAGIVALVVALVLWANTDWTTLYDHFHETTWSPTLLSLLPFGCVIAVGLRSPERAAALGGWLGFFVLRGVHRSYDDGAFWLSLAAAMPAAAVLLSSLGLLVPRLRPAPTPATASPPEAP